MILLPGRQPRMWQARKAQFDRLCSQGSKIVVFAICLSTAALIGLSYWIVGVLLRPDEPMSVRIMYRYDDTDYLPLIYALARLQVHEFVTLGGRGVLPFPLLFEVPQSTMIALLGDWGFAAADALVISAWFILFFLLAKLVTKDARGAALIGLLMLVIAGPWSWAGMLPASWEGGLVRLGLSFDVWGFRYTRPLVGGLFMLGLVLTTRAIVISLIEGRARPGVYASHGLLLGATAQGDLHLAMIGCFVTAAIYLCSLLARPACRLFRSAFIVTAAGFALGVFPMAVQQALGRTTDYVVRLGMFPVDRLSPPFYYDSGDIYALLSIAGLWGVISLLARRFTGSLLREVNLVLGIIFLYILFSVLTMPLSAELTGRAFLLYEFHDRRMKFFALGFTVALGLLLVIGYHAWQRNRHPSHQRLPLAVQLTFVTLLIGVATVGIQSSLLLAADRAATAVQPRVWSSTWSTGWPALSNYRTDFVELTRELRRAKYDDARVLATFDQQFGMWWLAFRQGYLFIPDPVLSNVSDASIEERTLQLVNLIGADARFLDSKLGEPYFAINFFSHDKWQASDAYTYGKHEDYSAAEIDQIGWTTVLDSWSVLAPRSERERLVAALAQITEPKQLPDLVILPNQAGYDELPGPSAPYRLAYENATFRVWILPSRRN